MARRGPLAVAGAAALLAALNIGLNRLTPPRFIVPAGLAAAAGALALAGAAGASREDLGLSSASLRRGVIGGLAAGIPIGGTIGIAAALPQTRRYVRDRRITDASIPEAAYQLLVAIPLASAVSEELIFRSALEGMLARHHSGLRTVIMSAAAFGAWHVLPALDRLQSSPDLGVSSGRDISRAAAVVATVTFATAAGGLALSWLRRRTGSVVAPIILHYAVNTGGYLGVWLAVRRERHKVDSRAGQRRESR